MRRESVATRSRPRAWPPALALEDGEGLAVVSRSLGHADLSTTADVCAHLTPAMLERAADRMDRFLGSAAIG